MHNISFPGGLHTQLVHMVVPGHSWEVLTAGVIKPGPRGPREGGGKNALLAKAIIVPA